jgi:ketosteroid isomerase-like protein
MTHMYMHMHGPRRTRRLPGALALIAAASLAACGGGAPVENAAAADEVAAAWASAFDAGDAAAVAALYAEDAHSMPPGGAALTGRSAIESYWREDIGSGGAVTRLTPRDSISQGDLLHVDGTYDVAGEDGVTLAEGQYQQLWKRTGGRWEVQHEIWRLDPALQRDPQVADRLSALWTAAYNAGDAAALTTLYHEDAELSIDRTGSVQGRDAIGAYWEDDFGTTKPTTSLTLTDVYMAGDLAHLEGEYEVSEPAGSTRGRYVQLWMRDNNAWRIHREMWWRQ